MMLKSSIFNISFSYGHNLHRITTHFKSNSTMIRIATIMLLSTLIGSACNLATEQTAEFRGPDRSGIFTSESELLAQWPEQGPPEIFYIDSIGDGYGSPVISNDRMYFTGAPESMAVLYCYDLDGTQLWAMQLGEEWVINYPGS